MLFSLSLLCIHVHYINKMKKASVTECGPYENMKEGQGLESLMSRIELQLEREFD